MDIPNELGMEAMGVVSAVEVNEEVELVIELEDPTDDAVSLVDCLCWRAPQEPRPWDFVFGISSPTNMGMWYR